MEYLILNNGIKMPAVGLGTWDIRGQSGKTAILTALDLGYRLIDTAQMYENEDIVGKAVWESKIAREDIFITSKLYHVSCSYKKTKIGIESSLKNLNCDYIDLVLIHEPYAESLEMYKALKEACSLGKVRAIGISNFNAEKYLKFIEVCETIPAVNQVESHVYFPQLSLRDLLQQHGTQMQSWGSFTEGRSDIFNEPLLVEIGKKYNKSSAQIALRYLIENRIAVIPKSTHKERLKQNLDIFNFQLSKAEIESIKALDRRHSLFGWYQM